MVASNNVLKSSAMYIGYLILKEIREQKEEKISIYDVSAVLNRVGISGSRQLITGLIFLYSVGLIEFEEANIWIKR